ncbi:hypothetical protein QOT17_006349, partial [Balamuthia mandrillaris]
RHKVQHSFLQFPSTCVRPIPRAHSLFPEHVSLGQPEKIQLVGQALCRGRNKRKRPNQNQANTQVTVDSGETSEEEHCSAETSDLETDSDTK